MATLKVGTSVKLNYAALSPGTRSYWLPRVGANTGTVAAVDANGRARVEFGGGRHGLFPAYMLEMETTQPGLFEGAGTGTEFTPHEFTFDAPKRAKNATEP